MVIDSGDVRYLLILDNYEEFPECDLDALATAWYNIYNEFSESVGGNRSDLWLLKQKHIMSMKIQFDMDSSVLRVVQQYPHPDAIEIAKEFGYDIRLDDLKKTFEKAYTQLMKLKNKIKITENEQENSEVKKEDFDGLITTLEKFQGYGFDEHKMTVKKFANIYKKYKDAGK